MRSTCLFFLLNVFGALAPGATHVSLIQSGFDVRSRVTANDSRDFEDPAGPKDVASTEEKEEGKEATEEQLGLGMKWQIAIAGGFILIMLVAAALSPSISIIGMTKKVSDTSDNEGWRERLGEIMEGSKVGGLVILLICVDLACTVVNDLLENTDLLNPKYGAKGQHWNVTTHDICVSVLCLFLAEQVLHMLAFGWDFFSHGWMVMDLVVVSLSLICETVLEDKAEQWVSLLIVLRLWKLVAVVFDLMLAQEKAGSAAEGEVSPRPSPARLAKVDTHIAKRLTKEGDEGGWRQQLGKLMEGPWVTGVVVGLIIVDLCSTVINDLLENTSLLNPKYDEQGEHGAKVTHNICVTILCIFVTEQLLHLFAFGSEFFTHFWMVMDLFVVSLSLACETVFAGTADEVVGLIVVLRLWKLVAFIFDILLIQVERAEAKEKEKEEALMQQGK